MSPSQVRAGSLLSLDFGTFNTRKSQSVWQKSDRICCVSDSTNATRIAENADVFSFPFSKELRGAMQDVDEGFNTTRSYNAQELPWVRWR